MNHRHRLPAAQRTASAFGALCWLVMLIGTTGCTQSAAPAPAQSGASLRVGIGGLPQQAPEAGVQQLVGNLSLEGLVNFSEDGRPRAWLAENWSTGSDGLSLTVHIRPQARFHDG